MKAPMLFLLCLASYAHAGEPERYSAHATIERARIGTHSARLAPPVRVRLERAPTVNNPARFERLECRERKSDGAIVCEPKSAEKVN